MVVSSQFNTLHPRKCLFMGLLVLSSLVNAGEGLFGWIYTLDLQPKGSLEFEQRLQLTTGQANGKYDFWYSRSELEYGLTDDIQVAAYLNAYSVEAAQNYINPEVCGDSVSCTSGYGVPDTANEFDGYGKTGLDGGSLEGIWRITNPVTQPVGIGIYLEPTLGKLKNAFESRLLVQTNFIDDRLILAGNLVLENEQLKSTGETIPESLIDILLGASYRFAPNGLVASSIGITPTTTVIFGKTKYKPPTLLALICTMPINIGGQRSRGATNSMGNAWAKVLPSAREVMSGIAMAKMK